MLALVLRVCLSLLALPLAAEAQQAARVYRIGILSNTLDTADGPLFKVFTDTLRSLGYIEHRNTDIEWRSSEGDTERLPGLAGELVRAKVDVILATALQPARAAVGVTKTIPIVFVMAADPVGQRLVGNAARPGGNMTGLASFVPQESSDRALQLLKAVVPKLSRLAVLTNPANPVQTELLSGPLPAAAQKSKMVLLPLTVHAPGDLQTAFGAARRDGADAMYVLGDTLTFTYRSLIVDFAARNRVPALYTTRGAVELGGLMSYGPQLRDLYRRAATYIDKILKGSNPGDLPVEQSGKYELNVNLKTARTLGLTIPPAIIKQAEQVFE